MSARGCAEAGSAWVPGEVRNPSGAWRGSREVEQDTWVACRGLRASRKTGHAFHGRAMSASDRAAVAEASSAGSGLATLSVAGAASHRPAGAPGSMHGEPGCNRSQRARCSPRASASARALGKAARPEAHDRTADSGVAQMGASEARGARGSREAPRGRADLPANGGGGVRRHQLAGERRPVCSGRQPGRNASQDAGRRGGAGRRAGGARAFLDR